MFTQKHIKPRPARAGCVSLARASLGRAISSALSVYVGIGREISVAELSLRTGISQGQIKKARAGDNGLSGEALLLVMRELGPGFTNTLLGKIDQGGAHELSGPLLTPNQVTLTLARLTAIRAETDADGIREYSEIALEQREIMNGIPGISLYAAACPTQHVGRI